MSLIINNSTAVRIPLMMVAEVDAATGDPLVSVVETASITVEFSKNGGAFTQAANNGTIVEVSDGWYYVTTTTTETNTDGFFAVRANATGCAEWRDYHQVTGGLPIDDATILSDIADVETGLLSVRVDPTGQNQIADSVLKRNSDDCIASSDGDDVGTAPNIDRHTLLGTILTSVAKVSESSNVWTVYLADGTTPAFTITVTPGTASTYNIAGRS